VKVKVDSTNLIKFIFFTLTVILQYMAKQLTFIFICIYQMMLHHKSTSENGTHTKLPLH